MFGAEKGEEGEEEIEDDYEEEEEEKEKEKSKISRKSKSGLDRLTVKSGYGEEEDEGEDFMERAAEFGKSDETRGSIWGGGAFCFWSSTGS